MTELFSERDPAKKEVARFNATVFATRPIRHLNQKELARRWSMSPKTLERWRWLGEGPTYLKIGGKILYRLEDIDIYEAEAKKVGKNEDLKAVAHRRRSGAAVTKFRQSVNS